MSIIKIKKLLKLTLLSILVGETTYTHAKTLVVSDSHGTGAFGAELTRLIEKTNEELSFYAFGGSKPIDWIEGNNLTWGFWEHHTGHMSRRGDNRSVPKLTELLQEHSPTRVIISQGTNIVWHEQTQSDRSSIQSLMKMVRAAKAECLWIGPPDLNVPEERQEIWVKQVHQELQDLADSEDCKLIESWKFTHYPKDQGDGVHYDKIPLKGAKLARRWAKKVYSRLPK